MIPSLLMNQTQTIPFPAHVTCYCLRPFCYLALTQLLCLLSNSVSHLKLPFFFSFPLSISWSSKFDHGSTGNSTCKYGHQCWGSPLGEPATGPMGCDMLLRGGREGCSLKHLPGHGQGLDECGNNVNCSSRSPTWKPQSKTNQDSFEVFSKLTGWQNRPELTYIYL